MLPWKIQNSESYRKTYRPFTFTLCKCSTYYKINRAISGTPIQLHLAIQSLTGWMIARWAMWISTYLQNQWVAKKKNLSKMINMAFHCQRTALTHSSMVCKITKWHRKEDKIWAEEQIKHTGRHQSFRKGKWLGGKRFSLENPERCKPQSHSRPDKINISHTAAIADVCC